MNIQKIDKAKYIGYLWYSDSKEPELFYLTEIELTFDDTHNPFVVEGWLINEDKTISYSVQYLEGKHIIQKYDFEDLEHIKSETKKYMPSFKGFKEIEFRQYWRPETDELCENMQVLVPAEFVFVDLIK